jgi:CRP-like cAMP-binding protein
LRDALAESDALTLALLAATRGPAGLAAGVVLTDTADRDGGAADDEMLKRVEIVLHLRSLDLFAGLTTRHLSEIAAVVREEVFPAGTAIVREGEFGDCMYLIVSGEVLISRAGQYTVTAKAGEIFGEMSLFDGETRFATVSAAQRVRLLRLDRQDLFELMEEQPSIAIGICQTLSRHARDSIMRLESRTAEKKPAS